MESLKILVKEHVLIHKCLDLLSDAANKIIDDKFPPKEFFEKAMSFCREYADTYHHYKEEHVMFGYVAQKKNGEIDAQIESHRLQHENCRNLIQEINDSLEGYSKQRNEATRSLHRNISDYYTTLRSHIKSENEIFFPLVNRELTDSDDIALMSEFRKYESKVGESVEESNKKLLDEMKDLINQQ